MDFESLNLQRIVQNTNSVAESKGINPDARRFLYQKNAKKKHVQHSEPEVISQPSEVEIYGQDEKKKKVGDSRRKIDYQV